MKKMSSFYDLTIGILIIGMLVPGAILSSDAPPATQKKIFVCDFHGVIADTNYGKAVLTGILTSPMGLASLCYKLMCDKTIKNASWKAVMQDAFAYASACQTLRRKVVDTVKKLKANGHALYLFSGLTPKPYEILKERYPELSDIFNDSNVIIIGGTNNPSWLSKSNSQSYKLCNDVIRKNKDDGLPVIFFDDKKANCDQATEKVRWEGVHVTSAEQCAKVMNDLA